METTPLPWQDQNLDERKREFARLIYVRPDTNVERLNAARQIYPLQSQVGFALQIANEWRFDPVVVAELDRLGAGTEQQLPDEDKIARDIYNLANDPDKSTDDRLKAYKLYAEVRGFIQKPGTTINNNNIADNRRVMVMPMQVGLDQFEAIAEAQQTKLIVDANG